MTNRFYRKPKPETMKKNREEYKKLYSSEITWLKENLQTLTDAKNKFLIDMYTILVSGSRKMTPKMVKAVQDGIERCKNNPRYSEDLRIEATLKIKPILEKIAMVERLAEQKGDKALDFVKSVKEYVKKNYVITKKQMLGLNKVYKRVSEDLFNEGDR